MISKTRAITKIYRCSKLTDTLNTWRKRFIMNIIMLCYLEIFTRCQRSMRTFPKHYSECKSGFNSVQKNIDERRLPISKLLQDNSQNNFLNFLTSKSILITLQYSGDILGIFLKQIFVECCPNILKTLLRDYWNLPKD